MLHWGICNKVAEKCSKSHCIETANQMPVKLKGGTFWFQLAVVIFLTNIMNVCHKQGSDALAHPQ